MAHIVMSTSAQPPRDLWLLQLAAGAGRGGEQEAAGEGTAAAEGPRDDAAVRWVLGLTATICR